MRLSTMKTKYLLSFLSLLSLCHGTSCAAVEIGIRQVNHCVKNYVIENGYANFDDEEKMTGDSVSITCVQGYEIIGAKSTTCLADGGWSKNTTCHIKDCGASYALPHGHVNFAGRSTTYNEIVFVSCVDGYEILGPAFLTCRADGSWSKDTSCVKKNCGTKYTLTNGRLVSFEGRDTTYTNRIPVACNDGYKIIGDDHITCNSDGIWSKSTKCVIRDCGSEFSIDNGYVNFTGRHTTYNAEIPVTCHEGYAIQGPTRITCLPDGTWSNSTECHIKDCGRKYLLTNGYANFPGFKTTYRQIVPILCNEGYDLLGDDFITCQADGSWSTGSKCRIKDCGTKYTLVNGHVSLNEIATTYNQKVPVSCNIGYDLVGEHEITCLRNGKWSDDTKCLPKDCGSKHSIPNAHVDFGGITTYSHTVPVMCNDGYTIHGDKFIKCLSDGTWSKTASCHIKICPPSFKLANGHVHFPNRSVAYQEIVPVTCDIGYEINGFGFISCLADGSWSPSSCRVKECGTKYDIDHGRANLNRVTTTYLHKAPVTCDVGYDLQGEKLTTCLADGTWSKYTNCLIKNCGTVYPLDFGYADFAGRQTTFKQKVPVKCELGYGLNGDPSITCLANAFWSNNTICAIKSCKNNLVIDNGVVHFFGKKETPFKDKVSITCDTGYDLHGDNFTTCRHDGSWNRNTICRIKDCGKNYTFANGHVTFENNDTTFNETVHATCIDGYEIQGDSIVRCQDDGTWSQAKCIKSTNLIVPIAIGAGCGVVLIAALITIIILKRKRKLCFAGRWNKGLF